MSVQSEITRISGNVSAALTAIADRGVSVPDGSTSDDLAPLITSISTGAELNFAVVGGTTEPIDPVENTIWVNTDTEITGWVFSAEEPTTPAEGMVWIATGVLSNVAFDIIKNVSAKIYPVSVKQYFNGEWVEKTAKSYQAGTWNAWVVYLFRIGDEFTDVTGGWTVSGFSISGVGFSAPTHGSNGLVCKGSTGSTYGGAFTANKVKLSEFSYIRFVGTNNGNNEFAMVTSSKNVHENYRLAVIEIPAGKFDINLSIAGLETGYVGVLLGDGLISEVSLH